MLNSDAHGTDNNSKTIVQNGSSVTSGHDLTVQAGRNVTAVASQISAKNNVSVAAPGALTLASAADEQHSYGTSKKVTAQEDHVSQVSTVVTAGGDVVLHSGNDLTLVSSKVNAGKEAYLVAGGKLGLLAAQDSDYSLYDMKKSGSFGSKETQHDEVTDVKNIGSQIKTGGDLTIVSGGDQLYQGAKIESGKNLTIDSGGSITFEAVKDLHDETHTKSDNNAFWVSASGERHTDETVRQSQLVAQGQLTINAVNGLHIDLNQINQNTVSQSIDAMVKADPQLAWLKEAQARGDVDWHLVQEIHDSFEYSNSGLGPASQLIIAIIMAAIVGPAALSALGGTGAIAAGGAAIATGAATNAVVSFINNGGDLGAVFKDVTSRDALKGYVIAGVTAGLTAGYFNKWTGTTTDPITGKINVDLSSLKGIGQFATSQGLQNTTAMAVAKVLGQDGDLGDALRSTLLNTLAAASFNAVGDYTKGVFDDGSLGKIAIHAMVGGLLAKLSGSDFKTGALAAGANEALVTQLNALVDGNQNLLSMSSQLVGLLAAATQKDADTESLKAGSWVAQNATQYNFEDHLPPGLAEYGQAATTLAEDMQKKGGTNDEIAQAQLVLAQGQGFDGPRPGTEFVKAWTMFMAGELSGIGLATVLGRLVSWGAKGIPSIVEPKIAQQMGTRGWTTDSLEGVIANPSKTVVTKDTRFDPASGTRLNDPATGYVAKDGSYVVRNDRTGAIVQVSDKNDKNWVAPWD